MPGVLDKKVTSLALSGVNQRYDKQSRSYKSIPSWHLWELSRELSPEAKFQFFIGDGLDYKGQANTGFESVGSGRGASFEFDFAQLVLPGTPLTASVGASLKTRNTAHRFLAIVYLPDDVVNAKGDRTGKNNAPLSFFDMTGKMFEFDVSLEVQVGFDASKTGLGVFDAAEAVGLSLEAKATAKAGAGYSYHCVHAHAPRPAFFKKGQTAQLRQEFMSALKDQRSTTMAADDSLYLLGSD